MDTIGTTFPARVNTTGPLQFALGGFLARYPPITRRQYTYHLQAWMRYCTLHGFEPLAAKRGHIEAWARHLHEERGLKMSSVSGMLTAICGFYKFAHADGFIPIDPAVHVRRPRIPFVSTSNGLEQHEAAEMLKRAAMRSPTASALMHLLLLNGLRIGECLNSNIEHVGRDGEFRTLWLPYRKGGKTGTLGLADITHRAIMKAIGDRTSGPILLGKDGQRLHPAAARRIVARLVKKCGITRRITPHSCRHSFITMALDANIPVRDIMDSSGHSNPIMVVYYDRHRGAIERNATYTLAKLFEPAAPPARAVDRDGFPLDLK